MDNINLKKGYRKDLPAGVIILKDSEVVQHQQKFISNWKKKSDTYFLEYAPYILGVATALTSGIITRHYRQVLKLKLYGQVMMYLPCVLPPAAMAAVSHQMEISSDILVMRTRCSLCLELKAAAYQSSISILYPTVLATITGFSFANIYYTYPLPSVRHKEFPELFKIWLKLTKRFVPRLSMMFGAHLILAMFVTYKEYSEYRYLMLKTGKISE